MALAEARLGVSIFLVDLTAFTIRPVHYLLVACGRAYRGTSLVRNRTHLGPYSRDYA